MKRGSFRTAFVILLLSVVAVLGFSPAAHAISGELSGSSLIYTYYDLRSTADEGLGLTDNYHAVVNTSVYWVQAHVRVRTGEDSIELLDFDILMSPKDVFTFNLFDADGETVFSSCDTKTLEDSGFTLNFARDGVTNDCWLISSDTFAGMTQLIQTCDTSLTDEEAVAQTKKGYVEIIGEGIIVPNSVTLASGNRFGLADAGDADETMCDAGAIGVATDDVSIAGRLMDHSVAASSLFTQCGVNGLVRGMGDELIGRQYYGRQEGGMIVKVASNNAEIVDFDSNVFPPTILHWEDYPAEQTRCAGDPACFAYVASNTAPFTDGATDLNYCLYENDDAVAGAPFIINKFGAAATYGPTLLDILFGARDGSIATDVAILDFLMAAFQDGYITVDGTVLGGFPKNEPASHYFALTPVGLDVTTGFAFIFPLMHYILEDVEIDIVELFNNDEVSPAVIDPGKFISPGLPGVVDPTAADEASLFILDDPEFAEGWIGFGITANNPTLTCSVVVAGDCALLLNSNYLPGYSGAVFNIGANNLSVSHFQYLQ